MKTLNVKMPLAAATEMSERGELNPDFISSFISKHINAELPDHTFSDIPFNYSCKINNDLHKLVKLKAIEKELPMTEFIGRLIDKYY